MKQTKIEHGRNLKTNILNRNNMKTFYQRNNIGSSKYTISFHNGIDKHKDNSPFFGIAIFKNKLKLNEFRKTLLLEGYIEKN